MKEGIKQIDGFQFPCCRRYYYHSVHSWQCQKENNLSENEDINYAKEIKLSSNEQK